MDGYFDAFCGITEEELHTYFDEEMGAMVAKYRVTSEGVVDVYNPFSVVNALDSKLLDDFGSLRAHRPT